MAAHPTKPDTTVVWEDLALHRVMRLKPDSIDPAEVEELHRLFGLPTGRFVAEDVFGDLFHDDGTTVRKVILCTDEIEPICESLECLTAAILADVDYLTGSAFLKTWESDNGPLPEGFRLCQVIPIVMGGAFAVDNFKAVPAGEARRYGCLILRTVRQNPDGTFKLVVGPDSTIHFELISTTTP